MTNLTEVKGFGKARGAEGNPVGNTGLEKQEPQARFVVGIDWVTLIGRASSYEQAMEDIKYVVGSMLEGENVIWTPERGTTRGQYYQHSARTPHGIDIAWSPLKTGFYSVRIAIPGGSLSRVPVELFYKMLAEMYKRNYRPSRVDLFIDDHKPLLTHEMFREAITSGDNVNFRSHKFIDSETGSTTYMGSRESDTMSRFYDKEDGVKRFETEFKDERACQVFEAMNEFGFAHQLMFKLLAEFTVGWLDFRDRKSNINITRAERLCWWQIFLEDLFVEGGLRPTLPKRESSLAKTVGWMRSQVETSLAMLRDVLSTNDFYDLINSMVQSGQRRYSSVHRAILGLHEQGYDEIDISHELVPIEGII